ncbi:hypothetical protein FRX31_033114, partial [Thalictrum thalictroides]
DREILLFLVILGWFLVAGTFILCGFVCDCLSMVRKQGNNLFGYVLRGSEGNLLAATVEPSFLVSNTFSRICAVKGFVIVVGTAAWRITTSSTM